MKIRMLGTGYGECKIKKFISKDYRHRGGVLIDGAILLDAPHDVCDVADELGFSDMFDRLSAIFISHSHTGHFDADAILRLAKGKTITVYADKEVLSLIPETDNVITAEAVPFRLIEHGEHKVMPLPSNHRTENRRERALNFVISRDKNLLYLLDGGFLHSDAYKLISELKFDAVIMDTAEELLPPRAELMKHGSYETNRIIKGILTSAGAASDRTRFILTHIPSQKKRSVHEELSERAAEDGFSVAYDGYFANI